ncbi:MAG: SET domain-containing protein [Candidatus Sungbacteria bacterium]|uniref:SET domain-containing protein n=1 Tax=Candidatus Sungiibacteriota bacterium TaxID=2750080 RepID=A0A933DT09_9BACT|nr:SET domain-containing protein [Candidatus Sungbacteria bacterium]
MNLFSSRVFVAETGSRGRGVFAKAHITTGEVFDFSDESWKLTEADTVKTLPRKLLCLCCEYEHDPRFMVCPTDFTAPPISHIVNHSCDPNMASTDNYETVVTLRNISPGEELTFDYATFNTGTDEFYCTCGAACCRGYVTGMDWRIPSLQERLSGYFQKNIQEKIDALKRQG